MNEWIKTADRLSKLPPYLFARLDKIKVEEMKKGRKLISLAIGDPDLPTPQFVLDRLNHAAKNPANHQYPSYWGMPIFRKSVAKWYEKRFQTYLDPESEVLSLIGSKEGIAHIPLAFINPGDTVLCPDPGYPVYEAATVFAGGRISRFKLNAENNYLPNLTELEKQVKSDPKCKLIFLNYPNNPPAGCATLEAFEQIVAFAKKHQLIVCHDAAYTEIYYDGKRPPSFLQAKGAKDVGIEFHSVSKTFNMTGWRVGFVVGNEKIIEGLAQIKTNVDSGIFNACQEAAIEALDNGDSFCEELRAIYQKRRDTLVPALQAIGLGCQTPAASFYAWAKLPKGIGSEAFVMKLIKERGIISTPGNGFGESGEGYVRFTFCSDVSVLREVASALKASI